MWLRPEALSLWRRNATSIVQRLSAFNHFPVAITFMADLRCDWGEKASGVPTVLRTSAHRSAADGAQFGTVCRQILNGVGEARCSRSAACSYEPTKKDDNGLNGLNEFLEDLSKLRIPNPFSLLNPLWSGFFLVRRRTRRTARAQTRSNGSPAAMARSHWADARTTAKSVGGGGAMHGSRSGRCHHPTSCQAPSL